jgi:hypothetical protein
MSRKSVVAGSPMWTRTRTTPAAATAIVSGRHSTSGPARRVSATERTAPLALPPRRSRCPITVTMTPGTRAGHRHARGHAEVEPPLRSQRPTGSQMAMWPTMEKRKGCRAVGKANGVTADSSVSREAPTVSLPGLPSRPRLAPGAGSWYGRAGPQPGSWRRRSLVVVQRPLWTADGEATEGVTVIWDRRLCERRKTDRLAAVDRRRRHRRRLPNPWSVLGFRIVLRQDAPP